MRTGRDDFRRALSAKAVPVRFDEGLAWPGFCYVGVEKGHRDTNCSHSGRKMDEKAGAKGAGVARRGKLERAGRILGLIPGGGSISHVEYDSHEHRKKDSDYKLSAEPNRSNIVLIELQEAQGECHSQHEGDHVTPLVYRLAWFWSMSQIVTPRWLRCLLGPVPIPSLSGLGA